MFLSSTLRLNITVSFQHICNALHDIQSARQSDAVAPEFVLSGIGVQFVVPSQHLLTGVLLDGLAVDLSMGVANIHPETVLLIAERFLDIGVRPFIGETL